MSRRLATNSLEAYSRDLARLAAFAERRGAGVEALTLSDLEAFVRDLMTSGLSPTSTARVVAGVRGFYKFLRLNGTVAVNPAEDLRSPRTFKALPKFLTIEDVEALLNAPDIPIPPPAIARRTTSAVQKAAAATPSATASATSAKLLGGLGTDGGRPCRTAAARSSLTAGSRGWPWGRRPTPRPDTCRRAS